MNMTTRHILLPAALIFTVCCGALAQEIHEQEHGLFATREISDKAVIGTQNRLVIKSAVNLSGKITITSAPGKQVKLTFTKQARAEDRARATDYIDLIAVTLSSVADETRLELRAPNPAPWNLETEAGIVEATLVVPPECYVEINAQQFDVTATGPIRGLMIASSLGSVDATNITDLLDIATSNRRVNLASITGDIAVSTSNSSIVARDLVSGKGQARFRNDGGEIRIQRFKGTINVKNSFGRTDIIGFEPIGSNNFIRSSSGPIILEITAMNDAQLVVSNQYEDIEITVPDTLSAYMSLKVDEDGVIEASQLPFKADLVERNRLNLRSGDGRAEISGTVRGKGNIYIRGTKGD
jgi:hypothetical protein